MKLKRDYLKITVILIIAVLFCLSALMGCGRDGADAVKPSESSSPTGSSGGYIPEAVPESIPEASGRESDPIASSSECDHNFVKVGNVDFHTAVHQCTKCGEKSLTTDPDSMPTHIKFTGPFTVSSSESGEESAESTDEELLQILNTRLWEWSFDDDIVCDYVFKIDGKELWFEYARGIFKDVNGGRQMSLYTADFIKVREVLCRLLNITLEVPELNVEIEDWQYSRIFVGRVVDPLNSHMNVGDKVSVYINLGGIVASEEVYPAGARVRVSYGMYYTYTDKVILYAEKIDSFAVSESE